jgi:hypothetical protein
MSSANFEAMSLDELKSAIATANYQVQRMNGLHTKFAHGAKVFGSSGEQVVTARNRVSGGWDGKAHDAASQAMTTMSGYMTQSQSASSESAASMQSLAKTTQTHHQEAESVPKVDTSFHASMRSSGGNPLLAVVDNAERHQEAKANHEKAVRVANSLNEQGIAHANTMRSTDWPDVPDEQRGPTPPDLPPPPGAPSSGGAAGSSSPFGSAAPTRGGGAAPVFGIAGGHGVKSSDIEPTGPKHPAPSANPTSGSPGSQSTSTAGVAAPDVPGGGSGVQPAGSAAGGSGTSGTSGTGGTGPLAGAGLGLAGGAAALGLRGPGGALPGRGAAGFEGRGAPLDGRGGAAPEGRGGARGGLAPGEEPGLRGPRGGLGTGAAPGDEAPGRLRGGAVRGGGGAAAEPLEGRPAASEPALRLGSGGLGAAEVAAERGGLGPLGGGGRRRNDDDEDRPMPDYLVETNDAWAGDQSASPAVIGE